MPLVVGVGFQIETNIPAVVSGLWCPPPRRPRFETSSPWKPQISHNERNTIL